MKKLFFAICAISFMYSCQKDFDGYIIEGDAQGIEDGKLVFIEKMNPSGMLIPTDTTTIKDGKFEFKGMASEPELAVIRIGADSQDNIRFILENGKINAKIYKDSLYASKFSGTYNNDELIRFNKETMDIQKQVTDFQKNNIDALNKAKAEGDTITENKLIKEYRTLSQKIFDYTDNYITEKKDSYISVLLLENSFNSPNADIEKIKKQFNAFTSELKNTKNGKNIARILESLESTSIGAMAPEFSAPGVDGKMISLKESMGKVTIIDFWASWCAPCRVENPHLVALYNDYKDKGLKIIGVSLDGEAQRDKWIAAIETDKLTWTQVSNLKQWNDPIAQTYNVKGIPAMFVLDESGKIVAKDLRGAELRAKIAELLDK